MQVFPVHMGMAQRASPAATRTPRFSPCTWGWLPRALTLAQVEEVFPVHMGMAPLTRCPKIQGTRFPRAHGDGSKRSGRRTRLVLFSPYTWGWLHLDPTHVREIRKANVFRGLTGYLAQSGSASPVHTGMAPSSVMQITPYRVAYHEKHVVHLIYKTRRLEKATDVKLIDNLIV